MTSVEVVNDSWPEGIGDHWSLVDEDNRPCDHKQVPVTVEGEECVLVFVLFRWPHHHHVVEEAVPWAQEAGTLQHGPCDSLQGGIGDASYDSLLCRVVEFLQPGQGGAQYILFGLGGRAGTHGWGGGHPVMGAYGGGVLRQEVVHIVPGQFIRPV